MSDQLFFDKLLKQGVIRFEDGKLTGFRENAILMPVRVMNKLFAYMKENFGQDKAEKTLKELGSFQIKAALQRYIKTMGWDKIDHSKIFDFGTKVTEMMGLGKWEFTKIDDGNYRVVLTKNPLAEEYLLEHGKQEGPTDFYISGMVESIFYSIMKKEVVCQEVKCISKGDKFCEFKVTTK